jgi:hypothetical protein
MVTTFNWDWNGDGTSDDTSSGTWVSGYNWTTSKAHSFTVDGTYNVKVQAVDDYGGASAWSPATVITVATVVNLPPSDPTFIDCADADRYFPVNTSIGFTCGTSSDPDGTQVRFEWDFCGTTVMSALKANGSSDARTYSFDDDGTGTIRVRAVDALGAASGWVTMTVQIHNGHAPTLSLPSLPASATQYDFINAVYRLGDADGESVKVEWDFDMNGTADGSSALYPPGDVVMSGRLETAGNPWSIQARAVDSGGVHSGWVPISLDVYATPGVPLPVALDFPAMTVTYTGDAIWRGQQIFSKVGSSAAQVNPLGDSKSSKLVWTATPTENGMIAFFWKVSSEPGNDILRLLIDGEKFCNYGSNVSISGEQDWVHQFVPIASGSHSVEWEYLKNATSKSEKDCAWVDRARLADRLPAALGFSRTWVGTGDYFSVVMAVVNTTGKTLTGFYANDITPLGTMTVKAVGSPVVPSSVAPGGTALFTWNFQATESGLLQFSATMTALSSDGVIPVFSRTETAITIQPKAWLKAGLILKPVQPWQGQWMTAMLSVTNTGDATAKAVSGTVSISSGASLLVFKGFAGSTLDIPAGANAAWAWTYSPSGAGTFQFAATTRGICASSSATVTDSCGVAGLIKSPAKLAVQMTVNPVKVSDPHWFHVRALVTNIGGEAALGVFPASIDNLSNPSTNLTLQSSPAGPVYLGIGASTTFEWTYSPSGDGILGFSVTPEGTGMDSSIVVSKPATAWGLLQIPAIFKSYAPEVSQTSVFQGDLVTVCMTASNYGEADAVNVYPSVGALINSKVERFVRVGMPVPAGPVTMPGNTKRVFTWTYEAVTFGSQTFSGSVTGTDANFGDRVHDWFATSAQSVAVNVAQAGVFKCTAFAPTYSVRVGDDVDLFLSVTNTGDLQITSIMLDLYGRDADKFEVVLSPPNFTGTFTSGFSHTFMWKLKAMVPGNLKVGAKIYGISAGPKGAVSGTDEIDVRVTDRYDQPAVAFPNPATGDSIKLGIKLDADAKNVHVDIYNSGMRRIYTGVWSNVTLADGGVSINGVKDWAPGVYWAKIRVVNDSGKEVKLDSVKLVVKR